MATLRWGAATDPGRIRPENEDNVLAEPNVFAVADGMGGHRAGEVASALAVDLLRSRLSAAGAGLAEVMAAIAEANGDIYRAAIGNPDQQGMGTTVTALVVISESDTDTPADDGRAARAAGPRQRRRLAHLPPAPRPAAAHHGRPQLRAGARRHRPHHRRRGAQPPAAQHRDQGVGHRPDRPRRRLDAAARARRPLPALQRRPRRRGARRRHRRGGQDGQRSAGRGRRAGGDGQPPGRTGQHHRRRRRRGRGRRPARPRHRARPRAGLGRGCDRQHVDGRRSRRRGHRVRRPRRVGQR